MRKVNYDFLNCAKRMPPLRHSTVTPFNISKSEVVAWLISQPEIMQKIFDMAGSHGKIKFNSDTGKWQGVDFEDGD